MSPSLLDASPCPPASADPRWWELPRALQPGVAGVEVLGHPPVTEDLGGTPRPTLPAELADRESSDAPVSILLVEDNPGDIRLVREVFERGPVPVQLTIARDGQEALALLQKASRMPDLILLDLNLPGTDGRAVLRRLKSDPLMMRTPVAVLTNSSAPQDVRSAYDRHANCYLVKPTDFASYERVLQRLVAFWLEVARLPNR
jgi:two-component system, chemotaxis family, response regulator Rcp1